MYSQPVTDEEQQWSGELETQWKDLAAKARQKDRDIIPDKRRFTVVSFCIIGRVEQASLHVVVTTANFLCDRQCTVPAYKLLYFVWTLGLPVRYVQT